MKMHIIINLHKDFFNYYLYKLLFFLRSKPINHFFLFNIILFLPSKIEYICIFFFFPGFLFMNKNVLYDIKITASRLEGYVLFTHYEKNLLVKGQIRLHILFLYILHVKVSFQKQLVHLHRNLSKWIHFRSSCYKM